MKVCWDSMSQEEKMVLETYQSFQQAMIDKDMDQLRKLTRESVIFTHMSGKKQTRDEFFDDIKNGILNYHQSNLLEGRITYEKPYLHLTGMSELKAKVYGITGTWRLPINQYYIKINGRYLLTGKEDL